jgi:hypothetical protein
VLNLHSPETRKKHVLTELLELLRDEHDKVRGSALACCIQLLPLFDVKTRSETIIPVIKNFCKNAHDEDYEIISKQFGMLLYKASGIITSAASNLNQMHRRASR